ncbi:CinA family protein [Mumia sp. zg.B17]|uniref:CinA family protein n=1 Tax=unclassified Mumia TaxID=2621872 RepID=UPI001C6E592F|nr:MULTISPECIES: CinA family protein [unclassified Mumia]MBW9205447.1 CinA family protein [Mumia sp. zg.B17]MBW9208551.1 CinA family protein [Mumia sp. zg.B21]MDD9347167.1 CinA family protein [Mumia sp.]
MTSSVDVPALVDALRQTGATVAAAESLTGGAVCARLVDVPGASDVVRGGVVAYATELKATLLGVDELLLATRGPVDSAVAEAMAAGVRERLDAVYGLATTGVAGPGPSDGQPAGTVYVAVAGPQGSRWERLAVEGDRAVVRSTTVDAVLALLADVLGVD